MFKIESFLIDDLNLKIPWSSFFHNTTSIQINELYCKTIVNDINDLVPIEINFDTTSKDADIQIAKEPLSYWQRKAGDLLNHLEANIDKFVLCIQYIDKVVNIEMEGFSLKNSKVINRNETNKVTKSINIDFLKVFISGQLIFCSRNIKASVNNDLKQTVCESIEISIIDLLQEYLV